MRTVLCISVVIGSLVMTGCAAEEEPEFAYAVEFEQAKRDAKSDFERDVLADNKVTDAEYDEAFNRFASCLSEYGYKFEWDPEVKGAYSIEGGQAASDPEEREKERLQEEENIDKCGESSLGSIDWLYGAVRDNPLNEDFYQLAADCLVRVGIREEGYASQQFFEDLESGEFAENLEAQACLENPNEQ